MARNEELRARANHHGRMMSPLCHESRRGDVLRGVITERARTNPTLDSSATDHAEVTSSLPRLRFPLPQRSS